MTVTTNTVADFARIQCEIEAMRFHAERLLNAAASASVEEPRIVAADQLAEDILRSIDNLPALYAAPVEVAA